MKTIAEQLAAFEAKKTELQTRAAAIVAKSLEEERTLDEAEQEEHAAAAAEVHSIDKHCAMLKQHEALMITKATPVTPDTGRGQGAVSIQGSGPISVKRNLPLGSAFTRYTMALAIARGSRSEAAQIAEQTWKDTPEVGQILKAAVSAGTTSSATWAGPLVQYNDMASEFIELLRPATILGRLSLRPIAFNTRLGRQTSGAQGSFVGEGQPAPVKAMAFDNVLIPWAKASCITVFSVELERLAEPSIEATVRSSLVNDMATYLDKRFVDPAYPGVSGVSPASVTHGVTPRQASGATLAALDDDVGYCMTQFATNNLGLQRGVWVMSSGQAIRLSMLRTNQDSMAFPQLNVNGGTFYGLPVIVSNNIEPSGSPGDEHMILIAQDEVFLADDGGVRVDVNPYATIEMDDAPSGTAAHSLWQNGEVGVKVDRWIYWTKRRSQAVQFIDGAQRYGS